MSVPLDKLEPAIVAAGGVNAGQWSDLLRPRMEAASIDTPRRIAAFVGQVSVESAGFAQLEENLHYSAARLRQVWPTHFPDDATAARYAMQPVDIADRVYANRMGNGDEASGDGWTFRGSGLIQLTGRTTHAAFAAVHAARGLTFATNSRANYARTPPGAAESAVWYWQRYATSLLADEWELTRITRVINGGNNGGVERIRRSNCALAVLQA